MFLLVLGRYPTLSRTEALSWGEEVYFDAEQGLLLLDNLKWDNPRDLPKSPEQVFLDRLGGTQRMAKVLGEFRDMESLEEAVVTETQSLVGEHTFLVGFSFFGCARVWSKRTMFAMGERLEADMPVKVRLANPGGDNLTSGRIFNDKLLKKGTEYIIWRNGDSWLLCRTVANQNLRNYALRDRQKDFRDMHMGMMPPKLAQILINLSGATWEDTIHDPFCGSGTVNIEAAISGYQTIGSDLNADYVSQAKGNFEQMAEKFRYDPAGGEFLVEDAGAVVSSKHQVASMPPVVVTEGWLGKNFEAAPRAGEIEEQYQEVLSLWKNVIPKWASQEIKTAVFCLPFWKKDRDQPLSLLSDLLPTLQKNGYTLHPITPEDPTFFYTREKAFVGREIVRITRS